MLAYFTELAARRRAIPRDDLVSDLLAVSDADDGRLTDAELLHNLTLLLVAGFETTTNLLGNGLQIILQYPPIGEGVRDGSIPAPAFVEEVLRVILRAGPPVRGCRTQHRRRAGGRCEYTGTAPPGYRSPSRRLPVSADHRAGGKGRARRRG